MHKVQKTLVLPYGRRKTQDARRKIALGLLVASVAFVVWTQIPIWMVLVGFDTVVNEDNLVFPIKPNRTLVVLISSLRGGELAWESLYKNVLDVNSADLALCVGAVPIEDRKSSLYERAKYVFEFPEYDDWGEAFDLMDANANWRDTLLPNLHAQSLALGGIKMADRVTTIEGSGAIHHIARWFLAKEIQRHSLADRYDRFVITRSDHFYKCRHDLDDLLLGQVVADDDGVQQDYDRIIWVPEGSDYDGLNDRYVVCHANQVLRVLNTLPPLVSNPLPYLQKGIKDWNPEMFLKLRWEEEEQFIVKRFKRMMFVCAAPGDPTRWHFDRKFEMKDGVLLKYPKEYRAAVQYCNSRSFPINKNT